MDTGFFLIQQRWIESTGWQTSLGNPRLYLTAFGYHHPLMALIDEQALTLQVEMHRVAVERAFGAPPGRGMFPPENAFSPRMIPALVDAGVEWVLVDYYVEAVDGEGHETRSPILHAQVGPAGSGSGPWEPEQPTEDDEITIFAEGPGWLHWGVNGWQLPIEAYWPAGTIDWGDGQSVETPLEDPDGDGQYEVTIGPLNDPAQPVSEVNFVFHWADDTWSSPDQLIPLGARSRGAFYAGGRARIYNSTLAGNSAGSDGGALFINYSGDNHELYRSIVTANTAGGNGGGISEPSGALWTSDDLNPAVTPISGC